VHEDHSVPVVAVNIWYHVGSRNEKKGMTGFAHLFEHFFFNGSENYPHGFREAMDDLGARNRNGTTSQDRTNFYEDVPLPALERTLYLEADRMGFLEGNLSKEMLERERGVVKNEKRQNEDQPYGKVNSTINSVIYPASHPYSWVPIGSTEDIDAASLEDIREWYRTYYGPNNAVLTLAGDITPERALELVEKYFGSIPAGPPLARIDEWVPHLDRNIRMEMEDRVPQMRIYRIYHAPAWGSPQVTHLDLFASVLSGSRSARLDRELLYEKGLVTGISSGLGVRELASTFAIVATVKPGVDPVMVEKEIDRIVTDLIRTGPTAVELERARNRVVGDLARGLERLSARADMLAESMTYGRDPEAYLDDIETTMTSTPADIRAASQQWIQANHLTMTVRPIPSFGTGASSLDRKVLPSIGPAPEVSFPAIQRATLRNGLKVVLLERHSTPLVNVALAVDAGYSSDPSSGSGAASLAMDLMMNGSATRSMFQISDDLDALGARMSTSSTLDLSIARLRALPMNLEPALRIFADVALHPSYSNEIVETGKKLRLAQIAQEKAQPGSVAIRVLPTLLYGSGHPYGYPRSGTEPAISALRSSDLKEWHARWFNPDNATLIVTGDITMDRLLPLLERSFGSWSGKQSARKNASAVTAAAGGKVYLIDKPGAPQSTIVAAHLSGKKGGEDDLAIEMVMRNFGGIATSRLNRNLRLDKHWSYGTSGFLTDARVQRSFIVVAPVQTDKTKESMQEVAREIREIAGARPIAGEEFASIMRNSTLQLPGRFESLDALENAAIEQINFNLPETYWQSYAGNVRALTEADLAAAAPRYIQPDKAIWVVVGDLRQIEKGIRELGLGEVVRIDGDGRVMSNE
jgi:zinc protease